MYVELRNCVEILLCRKHTGHQRDCNKVLTQKRVSAEKRPESVNFDIVDIPTLEIKERYTFVQGSMICGSEL